MTTQEKIAIMQAELDGKPIQFRVRAKNSVDNDWHDVTNPDHEWNFMNCDYRIKPEPHYRPFKNAEEVMEAIKEHGSFMYCKKYKYYTLPANIHDHCIQTNYTNDKWCYSDAMEKFAFADGTPFGKLED